MPQRMGVSATSCASALIAYGLIGCAPSVDPEGSQGGKADNPGDRVESATRVAIRVQCSDAAACALVESLASDVWSEPRGARLPLDVVVTGDVLHRLDAAGVASQILVPDIDAVASAEAARLSNASATPGADWFGEFRRYKEINARLRQLAELAPGLARVQAIGSSGEGREILAVRITGGPATTRMMISGTQHAREWISAMTTTCIADRLVRDYAQDPAVRAFVDNTELWVVPIVNPDGYEYTWNTDRYWRKNRRGGHGVDLNRNFSLAWGGDGSSGEESSDIYRGPTAFSEPESRALRDLTLAEHITLQVDFHSYSQLLMYPWNYTAMPAKDHDALAAASDDMVAAIKASHQVEYTPMPGADLYPAAGNIMDWMYGEAAAFALAFELRPGPDGPDGFVIPPEQIRPTCDEILAALLALRAAQ